MKPGRLVLAAVRRLGSEGHGGFAVMTALMFPVLIIFVGLLFEGGMALSYRNQSERVVALACERTTKPTRTMTPGDDVRRQNALATFDSLIRSTKQTVVSRDATIDWLTTTLTARFTYQTLFAGFFGIDRITYDISSTCTGIPPYPHDGAVLLSSAFTKPDGSNIKLKNGQSATSPNGCWGVYQFGDFGWDAGTGPGIEIQDWSNASCRSRYGWTGLPPSDFPTPYAIELDSDWEGRIKSTDANSSITKVIELHPGRYEISVWYNGRNDRYQGSNEINVFLQQTRPVQVPERRIIQMAQNSGQIRWQRYKYNIDVDTYSIYRIRIAAGGTSDTFGGIITSFQVVYLDTL